MKMNIKQVQWNHHCKCSVVDRKDNKELIWWEND
jgi:hypothetical protein